HVVKLLGFIPADHQSKAILPTAVGSGDGCLKISIFHFRIGGVPAAPVGFTLREGVQLPSGNGYHEPIVFIRPAASRRKIFEEIRLSKLCHGVTRSWFW